MGKHKLNECELEMLNGSINSLKSQRYNFKTKVGELPVEIYRALRFDQIIAIVENNKTTLSVAKLIIFKSETEGVEWLIVNGYSFIYMNFTAHSFSRPAWYKYSNNNATAYTIYGFSEDSLYALFMKERDVPLWYAANMLYVEPDEPREIVARKIARICHIKR